MFFIVDAIVRRMSVPVRLMAELKTLDRVTAIKKIQAMFADEGLVLSISEADAIYKAAQGGSGKPQFPGVTVMVSKERIAPGGIKQGYPKDESEEDYYLFGIESENYPPKGV